MLFGFVINLGRWITLGGGRLRVCGIFICEDDVTFAGWKDSSGQVVDKPAQSTRCLTGNFCWIAVDYGGFQMHDSSSRPAARRAKNKMRCDEIGAGILHAALDKRSDRVGVKMVLVARRRLPVTVLQMPRYCAPNHFVCFFLIAHSIRKAR